VDPIWLTPTGVVVAAVITNITAWLVSLRAQRLALDTLVQQGRNAERLAAQDRRQNRLERAYVALLEVLERSSFWAATAIPLLGTDAMPQMPSADQQAKAHALVRAHGSDEINRLLRAYIEVLNRLTGAATYLQEVNAEKFFGDAVAIEQQIRQELLPAVQTKHDELISTAAAELAHSTDI
jgi:hypothetical protein